METIATPSTSSLANEGWDRFVDTVQEANREFARGVLGDATRTVWSHDDDVTLFGGYGGLVEPGWKSVESRLTLAAQQSSKDGTYMSEEIKHAISGNFAYLLQVERYVFPGKPPIDFRVTIICRLESDRWKIIHRHGDVIKMQQGPAHIHTMEIGLGQ